MIMDLFGNGQRRSPMRCYELRTIHDMIWARWVRLGIDQPAKVLTIDELINYFSPQDRAKEQDR